MCLTKISFAYIEIGDWCGSAISTIATEVYILYTIRGVSYGNGYILTRIIWGQFYMFEQATI